MYYRLTFEEQENYEQPVFKSDEEKHEYLKIHLHNYKKPKQIMICLTCKSSFYAIEAKFIAYRRLITATCPLSHRQIAHDTDVRELKDYCGKDIPFGLYKKHLEEMAQKRIDGAKKGHETRRKIKEQNENV